MCNVGMQSLRKVHTSSCPPANHPASSAHSENQDGTGIEAHSAGGQNHSQRWKWKAHSMHCVFVESLEYIIWNHCEGILVCFIFFISGFMWSISKSLELPVKYRGIFQKRSSERTFHSSYKAICRINIWIDVVRCTWELRETWSPRQWAQMQPWDTSRVVPLPAQVLQMADGGSRGHEQLLCHSQRSGFLGKMVFLFKDGNGHAKTSRTKNTCRGMWYDHSVKSAHQQQVSSLE